MLITSKPLAQPRRSKPRGISPEANKDRGILADLKQTAYNKRTKTLRKTKN